MDATDELFPLPLLGIRREQEDCRRWCVLFPGRYVTRSLRWHSSAHSDDLLPSSLNDRILRPRDLYIHVL
jgi:hypothetical protein